MKPKIYGNAVTQALRQAFERDDLDAVAGIAGDLGFADTLAVCQGRAHIEGDSEVGYNVVYKDSE